MSIVSEAVHAETAKKLEEIILTAIESKRWGDVRSAVKGFAREELYQWYLDEIADSYVQVNPIIVKHFENK